MGRTAPRGCDRPARRVGVSNPTNLSSATDKRAILAPVEWLVLAPTLLKYLLLCAGACLLVAVGALVYGAAYLALLKSETQRLSWFAGLLLRPRRLIDELYIGPPGPEPPPSHARQIREWFGTAMMLFFMFIGLALLPLKVIEMIHRQ